MTSRILSRMSALAAGVLAAALLGAAGREEQEIGEGEAAPGRAQAREPGDAVAEVQERARQRVEVLHHLLLAELLDVERAGSARPLP